MTETNARNLEKLVVLKSAKEIDRLADEAGREEKRILTQNAAKNLLRSGGTIRTIMDLALKTLDGTARARYNAFKEVYESAGRLTAKNLRAYGQKEAATYSRPGIIAAHINRNPATKDQLATDVLEKMASGELDRLKDEFLRDVEIDAHNLEIDRSRRREVEEAVAFDIFLSFATPDKEAAMQAFSVLKRKRLRVFFSPKELKGGDPWEEKIRLALMGSREVCVMVSKVSRKREWVLTEWGAAWATGKTITPILVACKLSDLPKRLRDRQAVRFEDFEDYARAAAQRSRLQRTRSA